MGGQSPTYSCSRCGAAFSINDDHTELVRRDFVGVPRPSTIERLCRDCWEQYMEEFLDRDFETMMRSYESG